MPDPDWYLEHFRSHVGKMHELLKFVHPNSGRLYLHRLDNALTEVGEKVGVKAGHYIQTEDMSRKEKRLGKR